MSEAGKKIIDSLKGALDDIKHDRPMRVTEYSTNPQGKAIRKSSMKKPSEMSFVKRARKKKWA